VPRLVSELNEIYDAHLPGFSIECICAACTLRVTGNVGVILGRVPQPGLFVPEDRPAQVLGDERGDARRGIRGGEVGVSQDALVAVR